MFTFFAVVLYFGLPHILSHQLGQASLTRNTGRRKNKSWAKVVNPHLTVKAEGVGVVKAREKTDGSLLFFPLLNRGFQ
jgi:hypothetical protein